MCLCDDAFPLYSKKNTNVHLSALKKKKSQNAKPLKIAKGRHSTFGRHPAKGSERIICMTFTQRVKKKKELGVCEF